MSLIQLLPESVRDELVARRDRSLMDPRFQRAVMRIPGLRWIARRRARRVFDLCAGFVYSQILLACIELGLLEALLAGPRDRAGLAMTLGLGEEAVERLLRAAVSLELAEQRGRGRFGIGPLGAAVVGRPGVVAMIRHHAQIYPDLANPVELLRGQAAGGATAALWPYARSHEPRSLSPERVADYSELMAATQTLISDQVLDAYRVARHRSLLDVGGGDGAFLIAAARRAPALKLALFDLPSVADRARRKLAAAGLSERTQIHSGDFFADALPRGHDLISLVRVLHDHDDERVRRLLDGVRSALEVGGTLIVAEPMAETPGAERVGDAYFAFYLLAMGSGRARTAAELTRLLREAGFEDVALRRTDLPLQTGLLTARAC